MKEIIEYLLIAFMWITTIYGMEVENNIVVGICGGYCILYIYFRLIRNNESEK